MTPGEFEKCWSMTKVIVFKRNQLSHTQVSLINHKRETLSWSQLLNLLNTIRTFFGSSDFKTYLRRQKLEVNGVLLPLCLHVVGLCRFVSLVLPFAFSQRRMLKDTEEMFVFLDRSFFFIACHLLKGECFSSLLPNEGKSIFRLVVLFGRYY